MTPRQEQISRVQTTLGRLIRLITDHPRPLIRISNYAGVKFFSSRFKLWKTYFGNKGTKTHFGFYSIPSLLWPSIKDFLDSRHRSRSSFGSETKRRTILKSKNLATPSFYSKTPFKARSNRCCSGPIISSGFEAEWPTRGSVTSAAKPIDELLSPLDMFL